MKYCTASLWDQTVSNPKNHKKSFLKTSKKMVSRVTRLKPAPSEAKTNFYCLRSVFKISRVKWGLRLYLPSWKQTDPCLSIQHSELISEQSRRSHVTAMLVPSAFQQPCIYRCTSSTSRPAWSSTLWAQGSWRHLQPLMSADIPSSP